MHKLVGSAKSDLKKRSNPLLISEFTKELLTIEPRAEAMIPEYVHKTQVEEHKRTLVHTTKMIRQELVGVGVVASNYVEKARKAAMVLSAIVVWL